jgi:hypothetical protein
MESTWKHGFHLDSMWNWTIIWLGCLQRNSTWNPGEIQMDHVEHMEFHSLHLPDTDISVDSTWTPPGLEDFTLPPNLLTLNPNLNPILTLT